MKKVQLFVCATALALLTACGQSYTQQDSTNTELTTNEVDTSSSSEEKQKTENIDLTETKEVENNDDSTQASETETEKTTETAVAVSASGADEDSSEVASDSEDATEDGEEQELGVDEVEPPSYSEAQNDELKQHIEELKNQFPNQLLAIQLENGDDVNNVYAVITDGLKLPSDEEREFHVTLMAEAISQELDLATQAPNGTMTFVYEDQAELAIYHIETSTISWK
ncbi:hypothetical protein [Alkalicoccobacillus porphyridii]|uniref:Lipoprotein n=1 Tax=Alkalicoccobacillus porphyridii TaxID=2597270 RepID=A0A553ZV53_9BACI|nr:hypothetical protein [Alkalicoccobacillus porphyridii]TSB45364.1 hypothetical protein FN960_16855 [Alkalicoccobacillus porphyridii]